MNVQVDVFNPEELGFFKATSRLYNYPLAPGGTLTGRPSEIGHYGTNDGAIAFVDSDGIRWVARLTEEALEALRDAGYVLGGVHVPSGRVDAYYDINFLGRRARELGLKISEVYAFV